MPDATPWLERAAALAPLIRSCADESERERRLAADVVEAFHGAGLFRIQIPERFGGAGLDPGAALPSTRRSRRPTARRAGTSRSARGAARSPRCSTTRTRSRRSSARRAR